MTTYEATLQFAERINHGLTWNVTYTGEHGRDNHGAIEVTNTKTGEVFHLTVEPAYQPLTP